MSRRAAETLVEVVMAMTLFGVIMSGIFDFMGGQAHYISKLNYHSKAMYHLQKFVNLEKWNTDDDKKESSDRVLRLKFSYQNGDLGKLRIEELDSGLNDSRHMTFPLKPAK